MKSQREAKHKNKENVFSNQDKKVEEIQTKNSAERCLDEALNNFLAHNSGGYFSFLLNSLRRTDSYKAYSKMNHFFRPFIFLMRFFRILFISVAWIQASALLLIFAAIAIVLLPVFLLFLFVLAFIIRINFNHKSAEISPYINDKDVIVFFRQQHFSPFFIKSVSELSKNHTVLIVLPYSMLFRRNKGLFFLNIKNFSNGVIVMYEHFYFSTRAKLINNARHISLIF